MMHLPALNGVRWLHEKTLQRTPFVYSSFGVIDF